MSKTLFFRHNQFVPQAEQHSKNTADSDQVPANKLVSKQASKQARNFSHVGKASCSLPALHSLASGQTKYHSPGSGRVGGGGFGYTRAGIPTRSRAHVAHSYTLKLYPAVTCPVFVRFVSNSTLDGSAPLGSGA